MILKNLLRRKGRTFLTVAGIAIGVATIVALGAVARGMRAGFTTMTRGSQADLVLTQADTLSTMLSSFDQEAGEELRSWREVSAVNGVLFGNTLAEEGTILRESFVLGTVGGTCGIIVGLGLGQLVGLVEGTWGSFELCYTPRIFAQAVVVALVAGVAGGLYPAWRATRMRPVEALRYE